MNAPIYYVGGSKGVVGKSKVSFALIDYLTEQGKKVLLLDSDTSNPDVYKAHRPHESESLVCKIADLDVSDGWIELVNVADENPEHVLVINSAARSNTGIEKYGAMLRETLPELNRELVTFWVVNRQRDSVELLRGFSCGPLSRKFGLLRFFFNLQWRAHRFVLADSFYICPFLIRAWCAKYHSIPDSYAIFESLPVQQTAHRVEFMLACTLEPHRPAARG